MYKIRLLLRNNFMPGKMFVGSFKHSIWFSLFPSLDPISHGFVSGRQVEFTGKIRQCIDPYTGAHGFDFNYCTKEEVDEAVRAAVDAQQQWCALAPLNRAAILNRAAELIATYKSEIAKMEAYYAGRPLRETLWDLDNCIDTIRFYSGICTHTSGSHHDLGNGIFATVMREPLGVIGAIGAWNYPIQTCAWKVIPALACGNAVVFKPSPLTPTTAVLFALFLHKAGLPPGLFNVIQGNVTVGQYLVQHENVNKITFTGSTAVGRKIMEMCAKRDIKPLTLELGGKSGLVIRKDADINVAVITALKANFYAQGQVCSNASKVLVHASIYDDFKVKVIEETNKLVITNGDPFNIRTQVGVHISQAHMQSVQEKINDAVNSGAKILIGGRHIPPGFCLTPCILENVTKNMKVYTEEIFGAVMMLIPYQEDDEAIRIVNDNCRTGLAAGVCTKDPEAIAYYTKALKAGTVYVNTYNDTSPFVPFGGIYNSGFGRENGIGIIDSLTIQKSAITNVAKALTF